MLGSVNYSTFSTLRGNHPPGGQGRGVNMGGLTRAYITIETSFNTRDLDMQQERSMKIVVVSDIDKVSGQGA